MKPTTQEKRKLTIAGQELLWSANNAFAASTKMHPWLLVICEAMRRNDMDPRMHVLKSTGPVLLTQVIDLYRELYGSSSVTVLERSYLFPIDIKGSAWSDRHNCIQSGNCREQYPEAYGIHHFSQSWLEDYEKTYFLTKRKYRTSNSNYLFIMNVPWIKNSILELAVVLHCILLMVFLVGVPRYISCNI